MGNDQRKYPTIRYPNNLRPKVIIKIEEDEVKYEAIECEIMDMNERVIRLTSKEVDELLPGLKVEIQITFSDGALLEKIEGEIMINNGNQVYVFLPKRISLSRIAKEQNYLMSLHKS